MHSPFLQRFKEMREMHGTSSRDDRQKREQQRQEREIAKFAQMYLFVLVSLLVCFELMIVCLNVFWVDLVGHSGHYSLTFFVYSCTN